MPSNLITASRQYFVPYTAILTLDNLRYSDLDYHLTDFMSQKTSVQLISETGKIKIANVGSLPVVWIEMDNAYRPTTLEQVCISPDEILYVPGLTNKNDCYLTFTAFKPSRRRDGFIVPLAVWISLSFSSDSTFHIEYNYG